VVKITSFQPPDAVNAAAKCLLRALGSGAELPFYVKLKDFGKIFRLDRVDR
jgi:hypothetical protein